MQPPSPAWAAGLILLAVVSLSTGCTATGGSTAPAPRPATAVSDEMSEALNAQNPFAVLKRGMTIQQVRERVGPPDEVKPFPNDTGASSEIWVYTRTVPVGFREVASGSRTVPYVDPITGQMKEIVEPVFQRETVSAEQRVELLMVEGLFVEWKQRAQSARRIGD